MREPTCHVLVEAFQCHKVPTRRQSYICPVWGGSIMILRHLSQLSGVPELLGPESPACAALRVDCGANTGEGRGSAYLTPLFCLPVTSRCLTQEAKVMKDVCTRTEALVRSNLPVLASLTEH